jgi:hypothetical protein
MPGVPLARRLLAIALALAVGGCSNLDEAALVDPGEVVTADPGELRVLRHRDDPLAGDRWIDVLEADPEVFVRDRSFRQEDSRHAEDDEPADVRLLYEAVAPGRTMVVRLDCRGCGRHGVPSTPPDETDLVAWDLVVGDGGEPSLGGGALVADEVVDVEVGDHVVVVGPDPRFELVPQPEPVLRLVATSEEPRIDVFAVVAPGVGAAVYGPAGELTYPVRATER